MFLEAIGAGKSQVAMAWIGEFEMIDIGKILKHAWYILRNNKILWIFGILLAITSFGRGAGSNSSTRNAGFK